MDDNKGLSYFFLGLGIGVAVGMIFAPSAGAETRTIIRTRAGEGGEFLRRRGERLREGASGLIDRGREAVAKGREQLGAAVDAGRQTYHESRSGTSETSAQTGDVPPAAPAQGL